MTTDNMPQHLVDMFQRGCKHLTPTEVDSLAEVLLKYQNVFSKGPDDIELTKVYEHRIDTGDSEPVRLPLRRTSIHHRGKAKEKLQEMLDQGIVRPSVSAWASPVVLMVKKSGEIRWCCDYRALNQVTKHDSYPTRPIPSCIDQLARSK